MPIRDLGRVEYLQLSWAPGQVVSSLQSLVEKATSGANEGIEWYLRQKHPKKRSACTLRIGAILFVAVAGIIPLLSQMYPGAGIKPAWSSVALVIAATLVVFDHFFGCSTAWIRYMSAEGELRRTLNVFRMDWESCKSSWHGAEPTDDQRTAALAILRDFVVRVDAVIKQETEAWIQEFSAILIKLDESVAEKH